jgi:exosortase
MKHPPQIGRAMGFAVLAAASLLFWWRPLANTLGLALANEAYTHILLILPLSAALIYLDSKDQHSKNLNSKAPPIDPQPSPRIGAALLALALLIGCYARWGMSAASDDIRLSLVMFTLVTWWIASVVFCFGQRAFRSLLFPLCFLFLLVPVPEGVLNVIVGWLQHGSAWMATLLFRAVGEPVQRNGIFLSLTGLDIEVAKECSSIRSSCLLVITTMVLAHLFLRSWWRNLVLVLIAIPLSMAKNGLRIFVIAELGTHVDPGFLDGRLHHHGGIVFLVIALGAILALLSILHRGETRLQLLSASTGSR